jgi:hypothetical protein
MIGAMIANSVRPCERWLLAYRAMRSLMAFPGW